MSAGVVSLLAGATMGCDRPPSPVSPNVAEEGTPPPEPTGEPPPAASEENVSADAGEGDSSSSALPEVGMPNFGLDPAVVDALTKESIFQGRLTADDNAPVRKLDSDGKYSMCATARFGPAGGYFCEVSVPHIERSGHSLFHVAAVRVVGGRLKELFRFPIQARALDFPEAIYATLRAEYDDSTGILKLTDGYFPCEQATKSSDDSVEFQRVVNRLCAARGTYPFTGSTFRHKDKVPALVWKGPKRKSVFSGSGP